MKYVQEIPKSQVKIILEALSVYQTMLDKVIEVNDELEVPVCETRSKSFDIIGLQGLLKSTVKIELSSEEYNNFTARNGVDFPIYK